MFSAPFTSCSIGMATFCSTTRALAPTKKVSTVTVGGLMGGYWEVGRARMASPPAIRMIRPMTMAKTGRWMKYLTMAVSPRGFRG